MADGTSKPGTATLVIFLLVMTAAILGGKAMYGHIAYGDASCGFKNCVEVK